MLHCRSGWSQEVSVGVLLSRPCCAHLGGWGSILKSRSRYLGSRDTRDLRLERGEEEEEEEEEAKRKDEK